MKKLFSLVLLLSLSLTIFAQKELKPGTYAYITIANTGDFSRKNVPVAIKIKDLTAKIAKYKGQAIGIFDGGKEIFSQYDDMDKDGVADEVAFLIDLSAKEKKQLLVRSLPPNFKRPNFKKEVYTQMVKKTKVGNTESFELVTEASSTKDDMYNQMHHHGVAFETDLIAYRLYFDKKQTVDVYGKVKPQLEIAQSQWYPTDAQLNKGFGDDILKVGSSVGVGTFKGWDGKQATHFDKMTKRTQRIVATGSLRNVVEIDVEGWIYNDQSLDVKIRYTQYARHRDAIVDVIFSTPVDKNIMFSTGVQKMPENMSLHTDNAGLVGVWGTGFPVNDTVKYSRQTVGLGVFVPQEYTSEQAEDKRNKLVLLKANEKNNIRYYLTAASLKEKKGYKKPDEFFKYLDAWKKELENPLIITISEK